MEKILMASKWKLGCGAVVAIGVSVLAGNVVSSGDNTGRAASLRAAADRLNSTGLAATGQIRSASLDLTSEATSM